MKKAANNKRKIQRIRDHRDKTNGVYYDCYDCGKRWKVGVCPKCGEKLKGAYCKVTPSYHHTALIGEGGDCG